MRGKDDWQEAGCMREELCTERLSEEKLPSQVLCILMLLSGQRKDAGTGYPLS